MAGRRAAAARPSGRHLLRSSGVAELLVRTARVEPGVVALDLGAGTGMVTRALVRAGARVIAVERDPALARELARRFPAVDVRAADATGVQLPRESFVVAANLPFAYGTAILRRLLDPRVPLQCAALVVGWSLAAKRTALWPSSLLGVYWSAWHDLELTRRLPASVFAPPPAGDAAILRVERRAEPFVPVTAARAYRRFLERGFAAGPRAVVPPRTLRRLAHEHGFDRHARPIDLDAAQWSALYGAVVRAAR